MTAVSPGLHAGVPHALACEALRVPPRSPRSSRVARPLMLGPGLRPSRALQEKAVLFLAVGKIWCLLGAPPFSGRGAPADQAQAHLVGGGSPQAAQCLGDFRGQ